MCDPVTAITGGSMAVGLGMSIFGSSETAEAQEKMNAAQQQEIAFKKQQLELDSAQRQRTVMRQAATMRANSISAAQQGGGNVQGSGVQGALSAITSNAGFNSSNITQAKNIGEGIFQAESDYANASLEAQKGQAISGLGSSIFGAADKIGRVGGNSKLWNDV